MIGTTIAASPNAYPMPCARQADALTIYSFYFIPRPARCGFLQTGPVCLWRSPKASMCPEPKGSRFGHIFAIIPVSARPAGRPVTWCDPKGRSRLQTCISVVESARASDQPPAAAICLTLTSPNGPTVLLRTETLTVPCNMSHHVTQ